MELEKNIPEGWVETSIGELAELLTDYVANGSFASLKENVTYLRDGEGYARLIRLADHNKNYKGEAVFVNEHSYMFLKKSKLYPGDLIISNVGEYSGTLFRAPNLDIPMTLGPNSILMKFGESDDYMFYFLQGRVGKHLINTVKSGSANPKFNKTEFKKIEFIIPPLPEQKAIAKVLTAFDDKIELLQAQNKTLETMAQTIFKERFGKYQIGDELPEGWRVGEFGELFDLTMGLSPKGDSYNHDMKGVPLLNGAGDYTGEKLDPKRYTSKPTRINKVGDLVFCIRGTIGKIVFADKEYCLGRGVAALSPKESNDKYFNYIKLKRIIDELTRNATGSVILGLSKDDIKKAELILPSRIKLDEFSEIVKPLFNKIEINQNQLQSLTITRDTLLPKLMSGQVRVKNLKQTADA